MTLKLGENTIKFENNVESVDNEIAGTELKASFIGGDLVVEGASAGIEVYDISGRKVAQSNGGSLTVAGLSNGVYVVKTAGKVVKIAK